VERAKTLLAYYKGEITLEEIKAAGTRYRAEIRQRITEELSGEVAAVAEKPEEVVPEDSVTEDSVSEDSVSEELVMEESVAEESVTEEFIPEETVSEETIAQQVVPEEIVPEEESFVMPESETLFQENSRTEEELFVPSVESVETSNERLAELLKSRKVSIPEILKNFGRIERICKQVVKSLELTISDREKAYFVITGEPQTGKTTLALSLVRLLYELDIIKYDRTATIDAVQLNQVSIEDYGEELKNCNLIIENAGGMTKESIEGLLRFSKGSRGKTCVILEDTVRDINKFLRVRDEMNRLFNNRIHLGKYSAEDLFGFAYDYIKKEDYGIDKMAAKVLRDKIDEIVRDYSNDQRLVRTLKLVETVVSRAEKRTGELILSMATEGKIKQGDYLVIILDDIMD